MTIKPISSSPKMQFFIKPTKKTTHIRQTCDQFLPDPRKRLWDKNNNDFIVAYNQTIAVEGLPLDSWRSF